MSFQRSGRHLSGTREQQFSSIKIGSLFEATDPLVGHLARISPLLRLKEWP